MIEWIEADAVLAAHEASLAREGGAPGLRDAGLLASALERPINRHAYEDETDICILGATYAVGIAGNHPFVDGNKRTAFMTCAAFMLLNGRPLRAHQLDAARVMLAVAAGEIDIEPLADWLRVHSREA
ncbi:type II toxin-antitoxin system death-on-curing family toxin [Brevundimonas sp. 2R-24]|uniref:Type II toxin-antitoxin system death-on-curing family toxin n=1 Tax=Peiella sedimenti TaxID=3061083 RepID=A0ABT8SKR4_9CAUL|nr:type II toxin-antitoxin system death-on-curing family toxin [Caulobacteraceae bacterium XZ-24]